MSEDSTAAKILDNVSKLVPIIASLFCGLLWFGGRLESPQEKNNRIERYVLPITREAERNREEISLLERRFENHSDLGGHAVMESRMSSMERRLNELERK